MNQVVRKRNGTKSNLKKQLGARIKTLRMERGFTQEDLADAMGSHASYIGAIEVGQKFPRAETLVKIATSLEVSVFQLFLFDNEIPEKQRSLRELVDYLKKRPECDARFLLSVGKEHAKQFKSEKKVSHSSRN